MRRISRLMRELESLSERVKRLESKNKSGRDAVGLLREFLEDNNNVAKSHEVHHWAEKKGISATTLHRAKKLLGVKVYRHPSRKVWYWSYKEPEEIKMIRLDKVKVGDKRTSGKSLYDQCVDWIAGEMMECNDDPMRVEADLVYDYCIKRGYHTRMIKNMLHNNHWEEKVIDGVKYIVHRS